MDPEEFNESVKDKYNDDDHLNIMHFNVNSLMTKFDAFKNLVSNEFFDKNPFFHLIGISETHLRSDHGTSNSSSLSADEIQFSLQNYVFKGKSRCSSKKWGVGFFYQKDLHELVSVEEDLSIFEEGLFESFFLKIRSQHGGKDFVAGVIYLPTGQRTPRDRIFEHFEQINKKIIEKKYDFVITGDFNIDLLQYGADEKLGNTRTSLSRTSSSSDWFFQTGSPMNEPVSLTMRYNPYSWRQSLFQSFV
jgi:exonuclease III